MKIKQVFIFSIVFLISVLGIALFFAPSSLAIEGNTTYNIPNVVNSNTFEGLIRGIAEWFYRIMVPVASIVILYAAFLFLTSGGDEEKVKKAKRAITYAVVGVAIILIGAGFITFIQSLLSVNAP